MKLVQIDPVSQGSQGISNDLKSLLRDPEGPNSLKGSIGTLVKQVGCDGGLAINLLSGKMG